MIPSLTIDFKASSYLDGAVFGELVNKHELIALIKSEHLEECFDVNNYSQLLADKYFDNEKQQLEKYLTNYKGKDVISVKYGLPRHKLGRVNPFKALGLTGFRKQIRNTLIKDTYIDIDISNAQPSILYNLFSKNNLEENCHFLKQLIFDRETILQEVMTDYSVNRTLAKKLFLRLSFYGTFFGWVQENNLDNNFKPNNFIVGLTNELKILCEKIKTHNESLFDAVKRNSKKENVMASFQAFYLQTYERIILDLVCKWCVENGLCKYSKSKLPILTYEYDGIKLLKQNVLLYGGVDKLIIDLNQLVSSKLGFDILFEEKIIDGGYVLENVGVIDNSYETVKEQFELTRCKIVSLSAFIYEYADGIKIMKREAFKTSFENIAYTDSDNKRKLFIAEWFKDENAKTFNTVDTIPHSLNCPANVYNLWKHWDYEKYENEYVPNLDDLLFIQNHIRMLCNYQEEIYEYVVDWLAQMIQFPHIKTTMLLFLSKEGVGKGLFLALIEKMLGRNKVFEATNPSRDVWGVFNGIMRDAFLVVLNELNKSQTKDCDDFLKALITDPFINIRQMGVDAYPVKSNHRFIGFSNNTDPMTTKKDDRRKLIIRCSNDKIGDTVYFSKLVDITQNVNSVRTFYDFLKERVVDDFHKRPIPITEYQEELKEASRDYVDLFLEELVIKNKTEKEYKCSNKELTVEFNEWCCNNNFECSYNPVQFSKKILGLNMKGIDKKRMTCGFIYTLNIEVLKTFYKVEDLINYVNNKEETKCASNEY